jgi:hypothetical protein
MLGEVDLPPHRCFAEFIDNALDEGIEGVPGQVSNNPRNNPLRIIIDTPTLNEFDDDYQSAQIQIRDNGPGMSQEELEKNLRAGYSGKDPMGNMGLFGVGFNIATARLGNKTTVKTTCAGDDNWAIAEIDLGELIRQDSYDVDVRFEEKMDPSEDGTIITITQLEEFARTLRRKRKLKPNLGRMYTSVLKNNNVEIVFNDDKIDTRPHCVWSENRSVEFGGEEFPAVINIDKKINEQYYCKDCWNWWEDHFIQDPDEGESSESEESSECPSCKDGGDVVWREQRVYGWVGIQRYFDQEHYGIDLIRNGRVIEELDKSLFDWENPETGTIEKEYPIDTQHWGGRIIGELHIDFVPVTNVKDGFRKQNDRWQKVRDEIRGGKVSFRPTYAQEHGHEPNRSPLGKLFKGYRSGNQAGKHRLVPGKIKDDGSVEPMNAKPQEWAEKFRNGHPDYKDDNKWWEAVEKAEMAKRSSGNPFSTDDSETGEDDDDAAESDIQSSIEETDSQQDGDGTDTSDVSLNPGADPSGRDQMGKPTEDDNGGVIESDDSNKDDTEDEGSESSGLETVLDDDLSGTYGLDAIDEPDVKVEVRRVSTGSLGGEPVTVEARGFEERIVTYDLNHELFDGFDHRPVDTVLMEVSSSFLSRMDNVEGWTQSRIYAALVHEYCADDRSSISDLAKQATEVLLRIKKAIAEQRYESGEYSVPDSAENEVTRRYLREDSKEDIENLFDSTAYLRYASAEELIRYFRANPTQFFDGTVWERDYETLPSEDLRQEAVDEYISYLRDVELLTDKGLDIDVENEGGASDIRIDRAAASVRILDSETVSLS